ncbi:hypothetical protein BGW36DRAFT_426947 [Talaromyces proteolyticus]|uniref:Zn(2)-C6 fungal-type domain-containing protein n=1 Tax=Talaromyces proteolyticus TaxID=1131652 RepID=A0AAD4KU61_9EURO|nr:uncharacterized protein BGW36DRAFT_426947 [Talaromyces proteolyticus]KAH8699278.1 hypothetical protein BGW36DRAFT_426947 [Talaromyces proteolyticus]
MDQEKISRRMERRIRRAAAACYRCHYRKVRCDAAILGHPCTNCALDGRSDCTLRPNATSRYKNLHPETRDFSQKSPAMEGCKSQAQGPINNENERTSRSVAPTSQPPIVFASAANNDLIPTSHFKIIQSENHTATQSPIVAVDSYEHQTQDSISSEHDHTSESITHTSQNFTHFESVVSNDHITSVFPLDLEIACPELPISDIDFVDLIPEDHDSIFSGQHFLDFDRLSSLPMENVHSLAINGCLEIIPKAAIDIFAKKYFLLIHPLVPVLDEAHFWNIYLKSHKNLVHSQKMSLFVFQAMLVASCPYVPLGIIHQCGFRGIHDARRALYSRAKHLYDTNFESDPLARAQGALLLTFHTTAEDPQATMTWNLCALQNALSTGNYPNTSIHYPMKPMIKRLWWSIFVRDRILWLGRHHCPRFISANFKLKIGYPEEDDFRDEITTSQVYDPGDKCLLVKIFQAQCRLAVILSDIISIAFPASDGFVPSFSGEDLRRELTKTKKLKTKLLQNEQDSFPAQYQTNLPEHESITILVRLTLMHYQTARITLAHYETLLVENHLSLLKDESATMLMTIAADLSSANHQIVQTMEYFASENLLESIPLSVLAYCGTPMVLAAIDVKLSASYSEMADRKRSLDNFSEIIRRSRKIYDVTDFFSEGTNNILQLAYAITKELFIQTEPHKTSSITTSTEYSDRLATYLKPHDQFRTSSQSPRVSNWTEAFLRYPRAYLRISTCIDYSLATGRLPRDECLPPLVRHTTSMILGIPKLPWTLTLNDEMNDDQTISPTRKPSGGSSMNDPWYLTMLHKLNTETIDDKIDSPTKQFNGSYSNDDDWCQVFLRNGIGSSVGLQGGNIVEEIPYNSSGGIIEQSIDESDHDENEPTNTYLDYFDFNTARKKLQK